MKKKNKDIKKTFDLIFKIVLIIIIILLLIHNCSLMKKQKEIKNVPNGNIDIIDIKCDDNKCEPVPTPTGKPNNDKEIKSISFSQKSYSIKKGDKKRLIAIIKPSSLTGSKLTWKSSDTSIATVDANGYVKGLKEGTVTITVTSSNGKKATCSIKVIKNTINVDKIILNSDKLNIEVGELSQLIAKVEPSDATERDLVWESSDNSIATVDNNGVIKGVKSGTVTITVKTKNGKVVATCKITVKNVLIPTNIPTPIPTPTPSEIESLRFVDDNVSVRKDSSQKLIVEIKPSSLSKSKLIWKSSDTSIATVDENGTVKGLKEGKVTITITSSNGKMATCTVTVTTDKISVDKIILNPNKMIIGVDETKQIIATIEPSDATERELVWESSDSSIVTVDNNGIIKGIKPGNVTITVKTKDGKVISTCSVTVNEQNKYEGLDIYDADHTPLTWNGADDLKIFTNSMYEPADVIAPESSNTYQFVIKNSTKYNIKYNIKFIETNEYYINMKYKLKRNDTYIVDEYVSYDKLDIINRLLDTNNTDTYYLEWKWISSDNDTNIGKEPEAKYGLRIQVEAETDNG